MEVEGNVPKRRARANSGPFRGLTIDTRKVEPKSQKFEKATHEGPNSAPALTDGNRTVRVIKADSKFVRAGGFLEDLLNSRDQGPKSAPIDRDENSPSSSSSGGSSPRFSSTVPNTPMRRKLSTEIAILATIEEGIEVAGSSNRKFTASLELRRAAVMNAAQQGAGGLSL